MKDWKVFKLFNIVTIDWERRKIMKAIKGIFIPTKCFFRFTKNCAPFMFCNHKGRLLSIVIRDVQWKDKWYTPRHEENPFISIALFKKFFFNWEWRLNKEFSWDNDNYWEQALWYLYYASYNKEKKGYDELDINRAKETYPWTDMNNKSIWEDKFILKNERL